MSETIYIGADIEFMAKDRFRGGYIYPILPIENENIHIRHLGCDEFGHCLELRPAQETNSLDFVTNIMKEVHKIPGNVECFSENAHILPVSDFIKLMRKQGSKSVPQCNNVYGKDVLEDCELDLEVRKKKNRLLFCGTHIHVSMTKTVRYEVEENGKKVVKTKEEPIPLPAKTLVHLFDKCIYSCFLDDTHFNAGRYRSPGFYEFKPHGGFEYRSLGSSVFTPIRMRLIFESVKYIVENLDYLVSMYFNLSNSVFMKNIPVKLRNMMECMKNSKQYDGDLLDIWSPWRIPM